MPKTPRQKAYLGIDPGKTGGLAVIRTRGGLVHNINWTAMPSTPLDLWYWVAGNLTGYSPHLVAMLEKPALGFPGSSKSAVAKLHGNWSACSMALTATKIAHVNITPATWMRGLGIPPRKKTASQSVWKDTLRAKAQELFPGCDLWDENLGTQRAVCDALLIAEYCRRVMV